jgi:hypothetical protein
LNINSGAIIGTIQFGSSGNDIPNNVIVNNDLLHIVGSAGGSINGANLIPGASNTAAQFVSTFFAANLSHYWTAFVDSASGNETAYSLAIHPLNGDLYVSGVIGASLNYPQAQSTFYGGLDAVLSVFSRTGNYSWSIITGTVGDDQLISLAFNASGGLFMLGTFNNSAMMVLFSGMFYFQNEMGNLNDYFKRVQTAQLHLCRLHREFAISPLGRLQSHRFNARPRPPSRL